MNNFSGSSNNKGVIINTFDQSTADIENVTNIVNEPMSSIDPKDVANEIKQVLEEVLKANPVTSLGDLEVVQRKTAREIQNNSGLKQRVLSVLRAGGVAAIATVCPDAGINGVVAMLNESLNRK